MDIGNLFENLDDDYKDFIIAIVLGFPVAYLDCWKLHKPFRDYDLMPQIFLSLGIDVLFIGIGVSYCMIMWLANFKNPDRHKHSKFNVISLLYVLGAASTFLIIGKIDSIQGFETTCYVFFTFPSILSFIEGFIKSKKAKRKN